jgi:hypothetical protein
MDTGRIGILTGDFGDFGTGYDNPYRDTGAWFRNPELHIEDHFGSSVAGIGDFDGDGKEDILVGSINNHDGSGNRPGAAFILTDYEFDGSQDNNSITSSSHLEGIGGNDFDYSKYIGHW